MSDDQNMRDRLTKIETLLSTMDNRLESLVEGVQKVNKLEIEMSERLADLKADIALVKSQAAADVAKQTMLIRVLFVLIAIGSGGAGALKLLL